MQPVALDHAGDDLHGELYLPEAVARGPAVLVMHSALGLATQAREVAAELAGLGYVALASDMYGIDTGGDPARAGVFFEVLGQHPQLVRERTVAWFDRLAALPMVDPARIAAIGYCFGGQCVLELARSGADLRATVSFHGLLTSAAPAAPGAIRGEVVAWCGGRDPYAPVADIEALRAEMAAAGAPLQLTVFSQVEHGFTDREADGMRPGIAYDALAHRVSWAGTLALLEGVLRYPPGQATPNRSE